jgi:DNA-binding MarR family transcriptional regulator
MPSKYLEVISLIERLHRTFLGLVKLELDNRGTRDINNVQALVLFNIGDARMTVGELTATGCYVGSNVSYNLKKLVEAGYLAQERSVHDRRSSLVWLTEQGRQLRDWLAETLRWHASMLPQAMILEFDLESTALTLRRIERLWTRASDLVERSARFAA